MCEHLPELAEDPWICSTFSLHYLLKFNILEKYMFVFKLNLCLLRTAY